MRKYYANFAPLSFDGLNISRRGKNITAPHMRFAPAKWYSQHERENPRTLHRRTPCLADVRPHAAAPPPNAAASRRRGAAHPHRS